MAIQHLPLRRWLSFSAGAAALLTACAHTPPPTAELASSRAAVESARSAGAAQMAPTELSSALTKLEQAEQLAKGGEYLEAKHMAQAAEVDAQVARSKAASTRSQRALAEVEASVRALREQTNRSSVLPVTPMQPPPSGPSLPTQ